MAIDRIPGVGPTNADIATAVAAPSAATIASTIATTPAVSSQITASVPTAAAIATAVAAPSAATIAAAVAAPSAATIAAAVAAPSIGTITTAITTNAASAGVTLAAIGTQVANNAPSPNAWTLVSSTALSGVSTTISSLSGYKTYRVIITRAQGSGGVNLGIRFNADTATTNYAYVSGTNFSERNGYILLGAIAGVAQSTTGAYCSFDVGNANLATPKIILNGFYSYYSGVYVGSDIVRGAWNNTATITSITLFTTDVTTTFAGGTMYVLGAN